MASGISSAPFTLIKQHLYRQSLAIFGSAALALLLAAALVTGVQNVLGHERANLTADFSASVAYIAEQEQFLLKVQAQTRRGDFLGARANTPGSAAPAHSASNHNLPQPLSAQLAAQLTDYYTLFWAYSHFPSAPLLAFDATSATPGVYTLPALTPPPARLGSGAVDAALAAEVVAAAQPYARAVSTAAGAVHWLALPGAPGRMVGVLPALLPPDPAAASDVAPALWLATLMSRARLQAQGESAVLDKHQFWLADASGRVLLGEPTMPTLADGFSLTAAGLALCLRSAGSATPAAPATSPASQPGGWRGCYRIGYGSFFEDRLWLPAAALLLALAGVLGARGYWRWFQRQVIDPAQHTQQALAAANEAKSTFLATMSHEIRTPLYGVLGTLELLARTRLDARQQQYVARMQGAALLLQQQISDVLDLRSIEAGQLTLAPAPCSLHELVQTTTGAYADMASRKGLRLTCDIAADAPDWVVADAARLRQILANLLSNALKFTQTGGVAVRLDGGPLPHPLCIAVTDTGPGIAPDQMATLFTPFHTAGEPGGIRGAGLGLSICQRLAQLMESRIDVTSTPGVGSRFALALTVPAAAPQAAAPAPAADADAAPLALRVLVAEDNPINQATLQQQLEQLGCTVTLAADGQLALARWQETQFDAVLTDANMPNLDGYALARALRAQGAVCPIVGVSANALPDEEERCLAAGMSARLVKPVTLAALYRVLHDLCAPAAAPNPPDPPNPPDASNPPATTADPPIPAAYRALFHDTMRADLGLWHASLAAGDAAQLAATLHRIRGALAVVEQTTLAATLAELETTLQHDGDTALAAAKTGLRDAEIALQRLIDATAPNRTHPRPPAQP